MTRAVFTLAVCTSADGFIARHPGDNPASWASPEEQARFFADIAAADWAVMGRATHEVADRSDRRRIVFSTSGGAGDWRRPTQLWLDPHGLSPEDLANRVGHIHPLRSGLILGGTRVHDWFLAQDAIDRVHLTVEPVTFGAGLPVFSSQPEGAEAVALFEAAGFAPVSDEVLNPGGTRYLVLRPAYGATGKAVFDAEAAAT